MELKYAAELLQHLYDIRYQQCGNIPNYKKSHEAQALQTAIYHLETLQKVKEMGVVEKKITPKSDKSRHPLMQEASYNNGFNEAIDLKDAEFTLKIMGKL